MMNPFGISGSWRVDPDNRQDRGCSEVKSYKLSPEEIEALIKKSQREVDFMRKQTRITKEQLLEECRELGCNNKAYEDIAARYGFTNVNSVEAAVSRYGIRQIIKAELVKNHKETSKQQTEVPAQVKDANEIHDSGVREDCGTGAVRDTQEGKGRFDLITPEGLFRLARWYELGANKYTDRNWEKGIPVTRCMSSAMRHLVKYMAGYRDEDHLAAVAWNVFAIMHFEKFMPELDDRPEWTKEVQG